MPFDPANTPDSPESLPALTAGLKAGVAPRTSMSAETDDAIRRSIRKHFADAGRRKRRALGWSGAIAAVLGLALTAWLFLTPTQPAPVKSATYQLASDVDGDGRVDILDAYALARMLEARNTPASTLDVNNDGVIDARDVDAIAMQAVSLSISGGGGGGRSS